jgi:hypothetical protein
LTVLPAKTRAPFTCADFVNGRLVAGVGGGGIDTEGNRLVTLTENGFEALPGSGNIPGKIAGIVPLDDERLLIATNVKGLYLYGDGMSHRLDTPASDYAQTRNTWQLRALPNGLFAIGTVLGGVAFFDSQGDILRVVDRDSGLSTDQVHDVVDDCVQRGYWLATSYGIARIDLTSRIQLFAAEQGVPDMGQSMTRFNNRLFAGTLAGLFVLEPADEPGRRARFRSLENVPVNRRALLAVGDRMLAGGSGVYGLDEVHSVDDVRRRRIQGNIFGLVQSRHHDVVYASTIPRGVRLLQEIDNEWSDRGRIAGTSSEVYHVVEVPGQRLWLSVRASNGQYRIERVDLREAGGGPGTNSKIRAAELPLLNESLVNVAVYDQKKGLPGERRLWTFVWQGELFVSTPTRLFRYDAKADEFIVDESMFPGGTHEDSRSNSRLGVVLTTVDSQQQLWFSNRKYKLARISPDDKTPRPAWAIESLAGKHFDKLYSDDGVIWAKTSTGNLIRYDPSLEPEASPLIAPLLREIHSGDGERLAATADSHLPFSTYSRSSNGAAEGRSEAATAFRDTAVRGPKTSAVAAGDCQSGRVD